MAGEKTSPESIAFAGWLPDYPAAEKVLASTTYGGGTYTGTLAFGQGTGSLIVVTVTPVNQITAEVTPATEIEAQIE